MRLPSSITGSYEHSMNVLRTHKTLVIILLALFIAAGSGTFLRGDLIDRPIVTFGGPQTGSDDPLRACSGAHTIFADYETIAETQYAYYDAMSRLFGEHEKILRTPSEWNCGTGISGQPDTPIMHFLASQLPGWHVIPAKDAPAIERPVTFTGLSSVAGELQREYECKLLELQDRALFEVSRNKDQSPGTFCCTDQGCMKAGAGLVCNGPQTSDSLCDQQCPALFTTADIATRLVPYNEAINRERQRSRNALERSLLALRSADMNYEIARQLSCYQRASLDLRNELSLTADAVSCMPKIWDALTSIHDRKQ